MTTATDRRPQLRWAARLRIWDRKRARSGSALAAARKRIVADRWSALLAQIVIASFVVVMLTGVFLTFFYVPSIESTVYHGSYAPLDGVRMSAALRSTLDLSFEVRGGLLMRQVHHWGSSLMVAALLLLIARIFFTGAFRRPRGTSWFLLFLVLVVTMAAGFTGAALPDDLLSGTSLVILNGVLQAVPVIGTWLSGLIFGGAFPGDAIALFYPLHVVGLPLMLTGLIALGLITAGVRMPDRRARAKALGIGAVVVAILALTGAIATVNPIWLYGPADPGDASAGAGPLWYLAFVDGALRLIPPGWEVIVFGRTLTLAVLVPAAVATVFLAVIALYPIVERWATGDGRDHLGIDRARDFPMRTAIGAAGIAFYVVLWAAAGADTIATQFGLSIEAVLGTLRLLVLVGPVVVGYLAWRVCLELRSRSRDVVVHGFETGRIVRMPGGEYVEIHQMVPAERRAALTPGDRIATIMLRPDHNGRIGIARRARATASRWFWKGVDE